MIGILVSLIIWQQVQIQRLISKLMSRNYQDFATGERLKRPTNAKKTPPSGAVFDPIAEQNAEKANAFFIA